MTGALRDGETIDSKYRIVRLLGAGAWSSVYEGVNMRVGLRVAIKVMSAEATRKPGIAERFEREAQAATRIESEHVVRVYDLGVLPDSRPYIVMELLEGENLGRLLTASGPLSERRAAFYVVQALKGLGDAHAAGVLHRDLKPDNLVLIKKQGDEIVKIVDFGISKLRATTPTNMTQTNTVLGSPSYMSPEQCRGMRHMDHRSDIYSLGVVLFELLTAQLPHRGDTFNELMFKIALEDPSKPTEFRPDLDPELVAIVMKALARSVDDRFQTAAEFERALMMWGEKHGLEAGASSSRRTKLLIRVDSEGPGGADLRSTTQRPPRSDPQVAAEADASGPIPPAPSSPRGLPVAAAHADTVIESTTQTGDRAMSVSTPVPEQAPEIPLENRRARRVAGAVVLGIAGVVAIVASVRTSTQAGSTADVPSARTTAPASETVATPALSHAIPDPEPVASAEPAPAPTTSSAATAASATGKAPPPWRGRGPRKPPISPATATTVATPATSPPSRPSVDAGSVVDGRRIRTDF